MLQWPRHRRSRRPWGAGRGRAEAGAAAGNDFLQAGRATCGRGCLWEAGVRAPGSRSPERPAETPRLAGDSRKAPREVRFSFLSHSQGQA